jgi:hypothetical protein
MGWIRDLGSEKNISWIYGERWGIKYREEEMSYSKEIIVKMLS